MAVGYGEENKYAKYGQPTLDLVFTGPKESVTDRAGNVGLEFTRSSTATYVGSDGLVKSAAVNEARFDHDKDGNGLGLLIEESRTNILQRSSDYTTYWNKYNVTIDPNVETAPDGTTTASKMQWSSSSNRNMVFVQPTTDVTQTYTCSFYAKADEWNFAAVAIQTPGGTSPRYRITVDLTTGAIAEYTSSNSPTETSAIATQLPDGWWRVSATANVNNSGKTQVQMEVGMSPNNTFGGSVSGTPDGTSGIYIWGAQHEQGSFPTSYIPTSGSTVTRAVDTVSLTGTNFSSWYNGSEGSIFIDMKRPVGPSNSGAFLDFHNDAGLFLQDASGNFIARIGKETAFITLGNPATTTDYKIASSYQSANDFKVSSNGSSVTSGSTSVDFTTATELHIGRGNNATTAHWRNGPRTLHLKRFTFWPTRLSDSDLQSLAE